MPGIGDSTRRTVSRNLPDGDRGIACVFGRGHNRPIQHRINPDTAESSVLGGPPRAHRHVTIAPRWPGRAPARLNYVALHLQEVNRYRTPET